MPTESHTFGSTITQDNIASIVGGSECHEVTDEGMASAEGTKDADYWLATGPLAHVRLKIDPASVSGTVGTVTQIDVPFHHAGTVVVGAPAATFTLYAGSPLTQVAQRQIKLNTTGTHKDSVFSITGLSISRADYVLAELDIDYQIESGVEDDPDPYSG